MDTDSHVSVQFIERQKALTPVCLKTMAKPVEGSFVFTLLDGADNFCSIKGGSPICTPHFSPLGPVCGQMGVLVVFQ